MLAVVDYKRFASGGRALTVDGLRTRYSSGM